MFESDVQWVCTCPAFDSYGCTNEDDPYNCSECVYAMHPADLPE